MATSTFPICLDQEESESRASSIVVAGASALSGEALQSFQEGMELLGMGEPREAITRLKETVACAPRYSNAHVGLGIAYAMDSQVYPALDHFEKAAEVDPENFYAHFKLTQFFFKLRVPKKGYENASRALKCATTLEEKRLVAQILKEERQREASGVRRPTWDRPFSKNWIRLGLALLVAASLFLVFRFR
jgi:tetratricopeptide (TPR) repeat protein